jgi:hypothetical protein
MENDANSKCCNILNDCQSSIQTDSEPATLNRLRSVVLCVLTVVITGLTINTALTQDKPADKKFAHLLQTSLRLSERLSCHKNVRSGFNTKKPPTFTNVPGYRTLFPLRLQWLRQKPSDIKEKCHKRSNVIKYSDRFCLIRCLHSKIDYVSHNCTNLGLPTNDKARWIPICPSNQQVFGFLCRTLNSSKLSEPGWSQLIDRVNQSDCYLNVRVPELTSICYARNGTILRSRVATGYRVNDYNNSELALNARESVFLCHYYYIRNGHIGEGMVKKLLLNDNNDVTRFDCGLK